MLELLLEVEDEDREELEEEEPLPALLPPPLPPLRNLGSAFSQILSMHFNDPHSTS